MADKFPPSIYNTGGTILSASNYSRLDNVIYGAGQAPKPADLIGNMTEVLSVAQLAVVDFPVRGGSAVINSSMYLNISRHANRHLCSPASDIAGAIMFHGTNTLEETVCEYDLFSFFFSLWSLCLCVCHKEESEAMPFTNENKIFMLAGLRC